MSDHQTIQTPIEEIKVNALKHYDEVSSKACSYMSFIAVAIREYGKDQEKHAECKDRLAMVEEIGEALRACAIRRETLSPDELFKFSDALLILTNTSSKDWLKVCDIIQGLSRAKVDATKEQS